MYKLVEHPFNGKFYKDTVVIRGDSYNDMINMAISIALSIRSAGKATGVEVIGGSDITDLLGWVNDPSPTSMVYIDRYNALDTLGTTLIVLHTSTNIPIIEPSVVGDNGVALGVMLPLQVSNKQTKLDATDQTLLLRLEKMLPVDDPVRLFRDKIRNGEI